MSNHVNKCVLLLLSLAISACSEKSRKTDNKEILKISQNIMGKKEYDKIYEQARDTLKKWEQSKLEGAKWAWILNYQLDSIFCFNTDKNRMVTAILIQCNQLKCQTDEVQYLYGAKIKERWYFFGGGQW